MSCGRSSAFLIASDARPTVTSGLGVESCSLSSAKESLAVTEAALLRTDHTERV